MLINAAASTGSVLQSSHITPGNTCTQVFGLMSDVATARNFAATEETQILAAYFGDTWGNLYRYVPTVGAHNYTGSTGTVSTVDAGGCTAPIHYAPAIVQLDRDNAANRPGEIYLVQVTNSALDDETKSYPAVQDDHPPRPGQRPAPWPTTRPSPRSPSPPASPASSAASPTPPAPLPRDRSPPPPAPTPPPWRC